MFYTHVNSSIYKTKVISFNAKIKFYTHVIA